MIELLPPEYGIVRQAASAATRGAGLGAAIEFVRRDFRERCRKQSDLIAASQVIPPPNADDQLRIIRDPMDYFRSKTRFEGWEWLAVFLALVCSLSLMGPSLGVVPSFATVVLVVAVLVWRKYRKRRVARKTSDIRNCPTCAYDLSGLATAIDDDIQSLLEETGPVLCPECGTEWPLVPRLGAAPDVRT